MAIRTFVAAAALAAFTTPALATDAENIAILDDTVSTGTLAFSYLPIAIFGAFVAVAASSDESDAPVSTN